MTVLRVVDRRSGDRRRVSVSWVGAAPLTHEAEVELSVDGADSERVRWYLEDFAEYPAEPAPVIARDAEALLERVGRELFQGVFAGRGGTRVWTSVEAELAGTRVEIDTDPSDVPGLPWELLRDPDSGQALALGAAQFVRTHHETARAIRLPEATTDPLRVLLVICRPGGADDVPFRSVASRLVRSGVDRLPGVDLHVLRPPTFAQLATVLRAAAEAGSPFHVVHFDGHGAFLDASEAGDDVAVPSLTFGARGGRHGQLLFEDPSVASNRALVDGPTLGALLVQTGVPVLVLNACRSAYAEAPAEPDPDAGLHDRIRAYGSFAAEVADLGVPGVVAMRYTVYVDTAARFVEDLYERLSAGRSLGAAVSGARKALADDPNRQIGATPVALQDWVVPTVYEPQELTLRSPVPDEAPVPERSLDVPDAPDVGFFGRDDALLALDRAFDTDPVVLLHALAGAGKSTTAAEFGRWYTATGGVAGVLWTSFEHHLPLERVLDAAGDAFAPLMEARGVHWAAVTDPAQRRREVLTELARVPVLWVWDNVEPVAGFPTDSPSEWTDEEQAELRAFLRDVRSRTRAKVLLTSRRDENAWLGDLPRRVGLPPMPARESLQLTNALVRRLSGTSGDDVDWHPLLRFTGGNPLTIMVMVRQAVLRERVATTAQVAAFVARVDAGAPLEPAQNARQGRTGSLAASLAYGFDSAFTDAERARLALLRLFRDIVDIDALALMGEPGSAGDDAVAVLAGVDRDQVATLLGRAAELGLLTDYGGGYFGIHPALPWFFTERLGKDLGDPAVAERAYATAYAKLCNYYTRQISEGRGAEVLPALRGEAGNLRHALQLARTHGLAAIALDCTQGLRQLYSLTGRETEWARLVAAVEGDYVDPVTNQPRPGREDDYSLVTDFRFTIAMARRDWPAAIALQTALNAWNRDRAADYLDVPPERLDGIGRNRLRNLAVSEQLLGLVLQEQDDPACREHYQAQYDLNGRIGDTPGQSSAASNLGYAYLRVSGLFDLDEAQRWHQRSLDLEPEHNRIGRAASHIALGNVSYERFVAGEAADEPVEELIGHLEHARAGYQQALDLLPDDHHEYRASAHHQLGLVYDSAGDAPRALAHYQQAIRHNEARGRTYEAGNTRFNIALLLATEGRTGDALLYARAALANFQQVGAGAAEAAARTEQLIGMLEGAPGS